MSFLRRARAPEGAVRAAFLPQPGQRDHGGRGASLQRCSSQNRCRKWNETQTCCSSSSCCIFFTTEGFVFPNHQPAVFHHLGVKLQIEKQQTKRSPSPACPGWWDFRVSFYFLVRDVFICLIPDLSAFVFHSQTFQCWVVIAVQGSGDEAMLQRWIILQAYGAQHPAPYKPFMWMCHGGTRIPWPCFVPCTVCLLCP